MNEPRIRPAPPPELCDRLRAAADRLIAGTPLRSDGKLTIKSLAEEAGIKRWLLVNKYPVQLKEKYEAEFKAAGRPQPAREAGQHIEELRHQLRQARDQVRRLQAVNKAYATVIDQLSAERLRDTDGIDEVPLPDITELIRSRAAIRRA